MSEEETKRAKVGPTTSNEGGSKDSQGILGKQASESSIVRCKLSRQLHREGGCRVPNGHRNLRPSPRLGLAIFIKGDFIINGGEKE
jgi:hypothetical protein